ncbi:hypothetical protein SCFA_670005 [anaerobic digester metagenome]|uniref:Uncharacterized protein n=1 Tax=anaerobic digester metagenome TaxID=1263854 RepID=A0A485M714_9ZZZZ
MFSVNADTIDACSEGEIRHRYPTQVTIHVRAMQEISPIRRAVTGRAVECIVFGSSE